MSNGWAVYYSVGGTTSKVVEDLKLWEEGIAL